jgi:hypothetical protein
MLVERLKVRLFFLAGSLPKRALSSHNWAALSCQLRTIIAFHRSLRASNAERSALPVKQGYFLCGGGEEWQPVDFILPHGDFFHTPSSRSLRAF